MFNVNKRQTLYKPNDDQGPKPAKQKNKSYEAIRKIVLENDNETVQLPDKKINVQPSTNKTYNFSIV